MQYNQFGPEDFKASNMEFAARETLEGTNITLLTENGYGTTNHIKSQNDFGFDFASAAEKVSARKEVK